jgi:hypothetical protein
MTDHAPLTRAPDRNPIVIGLLGGIALLLLVLIAVVARSPATTTPIKQEGANSESSASAGQKPKRIDDPDRIRETLQPGKTYVAIVKASFDARVEDKSWGLNKTANLAYMAEMEVERQIERNDGHEVVERRTFVTSRNVKLLCDVEAVHIDAGLPGELMLDVLDSIRPGAKQVLKQMKPLAEKLLKSGAQPVMQDKLAKAVGHVDSLSGKSVRITYVDGVGVTSVQRIECELSEAEQRFIEGSAVLSDCYVWDFKKAPGARWDIDGSQLSGMMDPSLLALTQGAIHVVREPDELKQDVPYTMIRVDGGEVLINASDENTRRIGTFIPAGSLRFSQIDKIVTEARLRGKFNVEQVSKNHLLFETRFRSRPIMTVVYSCKVW